MTEEINTTTWPREWREWWEERAAIMHFDGGMTVADAEQEALECLRQYAAYCKTLNRKEF